jgi:hypothetical protein
MTYQFRALAEQAQADGRITAEEILALRRAGWADGRIEPAEAEAIFALNDHLAEPTSSSRRSPNMSSPVANRAGSSARTRPTG